MGRIVAIDFGQKRTGIAVTDDLQMIATGLDTVETYRLMDYLSDYLKNNMVERFVIGEPKQMNNTPSESAVFIAPFIDRLKKAFPGIPVDRADERFTSLLATRAIRDAGASRKQRRDKALVDMVSATILLQSYLDMYKS